MLRVVCQSYRGSVLLEYCALGSIRDLMETTEKPLTEQQIKTICLATLQGLVYLHINDIVHRDLKVLLHRFKPHPSGIVVIWLVHEHAV